MKFRNYAIATLAASVLCCSLYAQSGNKPDLTLKTVVIDPGHGGKDPGTISPDKKTSEKSLTLKISKMLAERIREGYPDVKVKLTRENDSFVDLVERARIASRADANLFISVHINALPTSRTYGGYSVYILGQSNNKNKDTYAFNADIIKRENSVIYLEDDYSSKYQDFDSSPESQIFMQLMSNAFREQSLLFAQMTSSAMDKGPFKTNIGVKQGNLCVLRQASMPAVLLELGFMTNASDLAKLRDEASLKMMVENLYSAFCNYKTSYDASVAGVTTAPLVKPETASSAAAAPAQEQKTETAEESVKPVTGQKAAGTQETTGEEHARVPDSDVYYGTQVMASSKLLKENDPYFKGETVRVVKVGNLYKYIIGISEDRKKAVENFQLLRGRFNGCFLVMVDHGNVSISK